MALEAAGFTDFPFHDLRHTTASMLTAPMTVVAMAMWARLLDFGVQLNLAARLGASLHPATAASLADLVRIMKTYYSNFIEGHNARPRDVARALEGQFAHDAERRNLQLEAAAHVRVQRGIDRRAAAAELGEPAAPDFLRALHRDFYRHAPERMLRVKSGANSFLMTPGEWRSRPEEDNVVGRHLPPSSARVGEFMARFAQAYTLGRMRQGARILAIPAAHHRFNYIHPFPDGNGRVSRLMSHAMGYLAGVDAHGLWSISRGDSRVARNTRS
jgi:Fic family protein